MPLKGLSQEQGPSYNPAIPPLNSTSHACAAFWSNSAKTRLYALGQGQGATGKGENKEALFKLSSIGNMVPG